MPSSGAEQDIYDNPRRTITDVWDEESKNDEPYSISDAKAILYKQTLEIPTAEEVNNWLFEHNAPWVRVGRYMDAGLPGYNVMAEETYYNQNNYDINFESMSSMMLVFAASVAAVYFGR